MSECCCHAPTPQLVRLPDGNAIAATAVRAVRALPRSRGSRNDPVPAKVALWLDGSDVIRIDMPSFRAACWARDQILEQMGVPPFPEYVPEAGEDDLPTPADGLGIQIKTPPPTPIPDVKAVPDPAPTLFDGDTPTEEGP